MWVLYSYSFLYNTKPIITEIFPVGSGPDAEETTGKFIYAVTEILAFLFSLPVMFYVEGDKFMDFVELFKTVRRRRASRVS